MLVIWRFMHAMRSALCYLDDSPCSDHIVNGFGLSEKIFHLIERDHAGGVTECLTRSGMGLKEEAIAANRYCGP